MADTRAQNSVADWIRSEWMLTRYRECFSPKKVPLTSGGVFNFNAVSSNGRIVANISTSGPKTATGKHAAGKIMKVRSDIYFLLLTNAERTLILLTDQDMHTWWLNEAENGRVPGSIEFIHVPIPADFDHMLQDSR